MPLPANPRSPSTPTEWEPVPLHVPAEDGYAGDHDRGPDDNTERDRDEQPAGSHVYVIDLA